VLRFRVANGEGKRVEHTLPVGLVAKFPKESDAWRELGSAPDCGADRIPRVDPLGPSTAFKVRGATRGQGSSQGNQGARRRSVITLAILSLPLIEVGKPPMCVPRPKLPRTALWGGIHAQEKGYRSVISAPEGCLMMVANDGSSEL